MDLLGLGEQEIWENKKFGKPNHLIPNYLIPDYLIHDYLIPDYLIT